MGIVFDTREGCGALPLVCRVSFLIPVRAVGRFLSVMGIVFDTRKEGEGARKKSEGLKAYIKAYIPQQKSTMIRLFLRQAREQRRSILRRM